jgi:hypothetical protein
MQSKLLTFQSWVTESEWFEYAKSHSTEIPFMLSDRSQCQDPFLTFSHQMFATGNP